MKTLRILALAALTLSLAACKVSVNGGGNAVEPSVSMTTRDLSVTQFTSIDINNAINVRYVQTDSCYARLTAPDNVMPYVRFKQNGAEIVASIETPDMHFSPSPNVTLEIGSATLTGIDLSGACTMTFESLSTTNLDIEVSGATTFKGNSITATEVEIEATGASTATVSTIKAMNVDLDASGASNVTATVIDAAVVKADASGASGVTVSGTAQKAVLEASGASSVNAKGLKTDKVSSSTSGASSVKTN